MKKLIALSMLSLFLFMCLSSFTENTKKKSRREKILSEKIDLRLDSIIHTQVYETIHGHKYHRFARGVLTTIYSDTISGVFIAKDRIHFKSYNREVSFSGIDGKRKTYRKTLKQLLFVLREPW